MSITYVTDPSTGGVGAFVDDTHVIGRRRRLERTGSRARPAPGRPGRPPGSCPPNAGDWQITEKLVNAFAGTSTEDTLLLGFGLEQLSTDAERVDLVDQALGGLIGSD